jgi:hypothetical protein
MSVDESEAAEARSALVVFIYNSIGDDREPKWTLKVNVKHPHTAE